MYNFRRNYEDEWWIVAPICNGIPVYLFVSFWRVPRSLAAIF